MTTRAGAALAAALLIAASTAACGVPLMKLPTGIGAPTTDAGQALAQAVAPCRAVRNLSAEVAVSGRVGGRRMRGRLLAGVSSPASVYLDAPAPFGASVFIFAATGDDATLLLPRDRRVLEHGRPADVLEAVAGVALSPEELRAALTGCTDEGDASGAEQRGEHWRMIPGPPTLYLRRERASDPWRLVVVVHRQSGRPEWRAEYHDFSGDLPRTIRLTSTEPGRFDLRLGLSQVEINVPLDATTFHPVIPQGYSPMTLREIRDVGPLADPASQR